MDSAFNYPQHNIDPRLKGYDWILKYTKAAFADSEGYTPSSMFWYGKSKYDEIDLYAMGKYPVDKFKKTPLGDEITDKTWLNSDWFPTPIIPKFREIAISKILERDYDVQASAIDPFSKTPEDDFYNQMKVKILMRQAAQQAKSPLVDSPLLKANPKEPEDLEQLEMQMDFNYKSEMCVHAEEAIQLIMQQNEIEERRKRLDCLLFDHGMAGWKPWIDETGMVKFREVIAKNIIVSYCTKPDFSDMQHCGEMLTILLVDLVPYFTPAQLDDMQNHVAGKFGNPTPLSSTIFTRQWDKYKVLVLDFEFFSWNTTMYNNTIDGRDNYRLEKSDFASIQFARNEYRADGDVVPDELKGQATPKFMASTKKVVYKTKWVIGTDYMYDYGLAENQIRKYSSWQDTKLSYILYAWNFYEMMFTGITERLMPIQDRYQQVWAKIQNIDAKTIPYVMNIDFSALESVAWGAGGMKMKPNEILDFILQNFAAIFRSDNLLDNQKPGYRPVWFESTPQLQIIAELISELQFCMQQMRDISGLNELTDGSTPNAKTLVPVANAAIQSTNNALEMIQQAEKNLMVRLSDAIMCKLQIAVKLGKVEGYMRPLGSSTVKFFQINPEISLYEFGIFLDEMPTYEERQQFIQELNIKDSQGLIDPGDKAIAMTCRNLKHAAQWLSYVVKKRKQQAHDQQMQLVAQQTDGNTQSALTLEKAKQQTAIIQGKIQAEIEAVKGQWQYMIEQMKKGSDLNEAHVQAQAKVISSQIMATAKQAANSIAV